MQELFGEEDSKQVEDLGSASGEGCIPRACHYFEWIGQLNCKVYLIQPDALAGDLIFVIQEKPH